MFEDSYKKRNQENYNLSASSHAKFGLDSTLYLAYRDAGNILQKHLFSRSSKSTFRILDYGCGAGLSTSIYMQIVKAAGYSVEIVGADISEDNLVFAKEKVPEGLFVKILAHQELDILGKFDLIICNFVLIEIPYHDLEKTVTKLQTLLHDSGLFITTNTTRQAYKYSNSWYTLNNKFEDNTPKELKGGKLRLMEDQKVSLAVKNPETEQQLFRFFDFFHSGRAFRNAYKKASLKLVETYRPLGVASDGIPWKSEMEFSPYKIHILYPDREPLLKPELYESDNHILRSRL